MHTMKHTRSSFFVLLISIFSIRIAQAQYFDPYRWINDPLAIADLGGADSAPIMRAFRLDNEYGPLDTDGYAIMASDTGAGIIRHLWATFSDGVAPDSARLRLYVDDSLLIDAKGEDFFRLAHGLIRSPFDTAIAGGFDCETQIPYKHSFRWENEYCWLIRNAEWQRIDTTKAPLASLNSDTLVAQQTRAEANYWKTDPWKTGTDVPFSGTIGARDTMVLAALSGPAYIEDLHFAFTSLDTAILHNLWLECYWDRSPSPSIDVPLSDFFGIAMGVRSIRSFRFLVDSAHSTLDCYFPMPFRSNAKLLMINRNSSPAAWTGAVRYEPTPWNRHFGYFGTQFHVTPEIAVGRLHPLLHAKGSGRYIGANFNYPDSKFFTPVFMEGDGYMMVDSMPVSPNVNAWPSIEYSGTEDYCNSGWYFSNDSAFSLPFGGCPIRWPTMYRFHIDDPYNYSSSIDIDWGHGFFNDYTTTYRTTAFYYTSWIPFYPSSDTIIAGNTWTITGAGYAPDTSITALLDADTIYRGQAEADGSIGFKLLVPTSWPVGDHTLSINGLEKPERITVLAAPKLLYVQDTANRHFSERDSIELRGYGFNPGELLTVMLGDTIFPAPSTIVTDTDGVFRTKIFLPWVPEGYYHVYAKRLSGMIVTSDSSLFVTRTLNYEFEDLPMTGGAFYSYVSPQWSQGAIAFCNGNWKRGSEFDFTFQVPFADSFAATVFGVSSDRYGIYRTYIDGTDMGVYDWFRNQPWDVLTRDSSNLSPIWLDKGQHLIRFVNEGWDSGAVEYSVAPDNLHLRPLSSSSGSVLDVTPTIPAKMPLVAFPDPLDQLVLSISGIPDSAATIPAILYNELGKRVLQTFLLPESGVRTLYIPSLPNGSYWLSLQFSSGRQVIPFQLHR